jgi:hypothetical protein
MKKYYILLLFVCCLSSCFTIKDNIEDWTVNYINKNDSSIIKIKNLYNTTGKLFFNDKIKSNIDEDELYSKAQLFKPTSNQILVGEDIMILSWISKNDSKISVISELRKFYRQYTGYVCQNGDSVIVINLLSKSSLSKEQQLGIQTRFIYDVLFDDDNVVIDVKKSYRIRPTIVHVSLKNKIVMSTSTYFCIPHHKVP